MLRSLLQCVAILWLFCTNGCHCLAGLGMSHRVPAIRSTRTTPKQRLPCFIVTFSRKANQHRPYVPTESFAAPFSFSPFSSSPRVLCKASSSSLDDVDNQPAVQKLDENEAVPTVSWTKQQFQLSIPAFLALLVDPLLSLVDTVFVGRLGTSAMGALGACTSIFHLAFNTFRATTWATTSLVAPYHAKNNNENNKNDENELMAVSRLSLQWGVLMGIGVGLLLIIGGAPILATMGIARESPLFAPASAYLTTRAWAAPCVACIAVSTGLFRGAGNTWVPLRASIVASLLNLGLDPLLMFGKTFGWGVRGAAAATAVSQAAAAVVLGMALVSRGMVHLKPSVSLDPATKRRVLSTIATANASMMAKQGSLLGAWAYCTAQATRLGPAHVAAHQVALSVWLLVALTLDSNAVAAQILASRHYKGPSTTFRSLLRFQAQLAVGQGLLATFLISTVLAPFIPHVMGTDAAVRGHLQQLMPALAGQQLLVSCTLVTEALATATQQFTFLAVGTVLATVLSIWQLQTPTTVAGLWNRGIVTLFAGRWLTATLALARALRSRKRGFDNTNNNNNS